MEGTSTFVTTSCPFSDVVNLIGVFTCIGQFLRLFALFRRFLRSGENSSRIHVDKMHAFAIGLHAILRELAQHSLPETARYHIQENGELHFEEHTACNSHESRRTRDLPWYIITLCQGACGPFVIPNDAFGDIRPQHCSLAHPRPLPTRNSHTSEKKMA